jgi:hypothetical protein
MYLKVPLRYPRNNITELIDELSQVNIKLFFVFFSKYMLYEPLLLIMYI